MSQNPIHFRTLTELSAGLTAREYSSEELAEHFLSRIESLNGALNAFNLVTADRALAEAHAADVQLAAGRSLGALHGIPYAVKDIFDVGGLPTTAGSRLLEGYRPSEDSHATRRLAQAGMVVLGKTITVEFARGVIGVNHIQGTPHNPWHEVAHIPGGSSAGSAVAVAAGLAPIALGSDTGGSVRAPAALCGTVGLKTTVGRISRYGVFPMSEYLDTVGLLTRSVEDCALVYQAMLGEDVRDPSTVGITHHDVTRSLKAGVKGLRIGLPTDVFLDELDPDVERAFEKATSIFEELGTTLIPLSIPEAAPADSLGKTITNAEACVVHEQRLEEQVDDMDPVVGPRMLAERDITAVQYIKALRTVRDLRKSLEDTLRDVDALLVPTTALPALPVSEVDKDLSSYAAYTKVYSRNTRIGSVLDLCGLSVPCGFTQKGLPIGLLICGKPFNEDIVLRAGYAYEQACDWHNQTPSLSWLE